MDYNSNANLETRFGRSMSPRNPTKYPQDHPKWAKKSPQKLPNQSFDTKLWFFKNIRISIVKPLFLKLGEAVRELKIDSKRFRKEIKKHIDARDRQRGVKLALRACRQRRVKLALRACRQRGVKLALRENCLGGVVGLFLVRFGCSRGLFKTRFGSPEGLQESKSAWRIPENWPKKKNTMRKNDLAIYHFSLLVVGS